MQPHRLPVARSPVPALILVFLLTGCSTLRQVSAGPVLASEAGTGSAGAAVAGHLGAGGRWHHDEDDDTHSERDLKHLANAIVPLGIETTFRFAATSGFVSAATGSGYYFTADVGRHMVFGRIDGLLTFNGPERLRVGAGGRAELGFALGAFGETLDTDGLFAFRRRNYLTLGLFAEYTAQFSRPATMPMIGIGLGFAHEAVFAGFARRRSSSQ